MILEGMLKFSNLYLQINWSLGIRNSPAIETQGQFYQPFCANVPFNFTYRITTKSISTHNSNAVCYTSLCQKKQNKSTAAKAAQKILAKLDPTHLRKTTSLQVYSH